MLPFGSTVIAGTRWSPLLNGLSLTSPPTFSPSALYFWPTMASPAGLWTRLSSDQATT